MTGDAAGRRPDDATAAPAGGSPAGGSPAGGHPAESRTTDGRAADDRATGEGPASHRPVELSAADRLADALDRARDLPTSPDKLAELEAVRVAADAIGEVRLGFETRLELVDTCLESAEAARVPGLFAWCRTVADREPMLFTDAEHEMLRWYHVWAVGAFRGSPEVGLHETVRLLEDLERRCREDGRSLATVHRLRCELADHRGDEAGAREWLARWERAAAEDAESSSQDGAFCPACETADRALLRAGWGDWQGAVDAVAPVLDGTLTCHEQPERALAAVMIPYLRLGRTGEAAAAHLNSYRRHRLERASFPFLADHLRFCALAGQAGRGLDLLETHLGDLDEPYDEMSALRFAAAGALVCRRAAAEGLGERRLHRPTYGDRPAAELTVTDLGVVLARIAATLASRFDTRNGTSHQSRRVGAWLVERPPGAAVTDGNEDASGEAGGGSALVLAALTLESILEVLDARGDHYGVDVDGTVAGRWRSAFIQFERLGERREILQVRAIAERRLPVSRLVEAYGFCNAWNHDKLMPKAYVHDDGEGWLVLAADATTDLEHGATVAQLAALVDAAIVMGTAFADAVAELP